MRTFDEVVVVLYQVISRLVTSNRLASYKFQNRSGFGSSHWVFAADLDHIKVNRFFVVLPFCIFLQSLELLQMMHSLGKLDGIAVFLLLFRSLG